MDYVPALIGALGGLGAGAAYTFVRKMGLQGEEGARIVFYFSLFSCVVTLPMFLLGGAAMAPWQFFCLLAAGLCGAGGQFSITKAYCYAPAREISVYDYCCSVGLCPFRTAARCAECGGLCCHHRRSGLDVSLQPPPGSRWAGCAAGAFLRRI